MATVGARAGYAEEHQTREGNGPPAVGKSTHEKQDTIVALRKQLEEMKSANLKMQTQLQAAKETHSMDSRKIRSLERKLA